LYAQVRHTVAALIALALACLAAPASAWIETRAKGMLSTVEVARDGHATVSHELLLEVRGGPLKKLELATADSDAELLPDATVTRVSTGMVLPLLVERGADGALSLEIDHERGLRTGTYLFVVRYGTALLKNKLARRDRTVVLSWTGPRLDSGVDGVRTIFRLPASELAPRVPAIAEGEPDPGFGVLVSAVRRTSLHDEIELVRSHVARGEPVLWRVEASATALAAASTEAPATASAAEPVVTAPAPRRAPRWLSWALGTAVLVGALVTLKARAFARVCALGGASPRSLVPLPLWLRAPLAGLAAGGALFVGADREDATLAGLLLLVALPLATLGTPGRPRAPRSPGRWLPLRGEEAFAAPRVVLPGEWLDSGTLRGFGLLLLTLLGLAALALLELRHSPYRALLVVLTGSVVVPIFFTGRASDVLGDRVAFSRRFIERLDRRLRGRAELKVVPWGRVPDGSSTPDELRLLAQPRAAVDGLVAREVALEPRTGLGGAVAAPFVIVRVKEDSRAQRVLPNGVIWTRGRKPDERVAILSPKLPTLGLTLRLIERLLGLLARQDEPASKSARRSSGSSAFTRKLGKVASPAHAM
jgi:hypothetical protein